MERQHHGFEYEQKVIAKYGLKKDEGYTGKWDTAFNGIPCSIKCEKLGSDVEMGDYFRNASNSEDFYLIVGFWEHDKENIVEEHILYIPSKKYSSLFDEKMSEKFKLLLSEATNDREYDKVWKSKITTLRKEWANATDNLIRPRFKRDHKTQKRIQCAINNKDFYNFFIKNFEVE